MRFDEILFHNGFDIARRDGVKIEDIGDRDANGFTAGIIVHGYIN
jgi:hypothetical protein